MPWADVILNQDLLTGTLKEEERMKGIKTKNYFTRVMGWGVVAAALAIGAQGCTVMDQRSLKELEGAYGVNKPKIEASFASPWLSPRDIWRVYLNGSDPDGDIRWIQVSLWVPGGVMTTARIDVDPDQAAKMSGYLTLHSMDLPESLLRFGNSDLRLYVALEDRAGHVSERVVLSVSMALGSIQEGPPGGRFQEKFLGEVPVRFLQFSPTAGIGTWP